MTPALRVESEARTHVGHVRELNEDSFCARERAGLWAVADGMGGHEGGEWASAALAEALDANDLASDFDAAGRAVVERMQAANVKIWARAQERGTVMGTTAVAVLVRERRYGVFWVGDSRGYLLRAGTLRRLTRDHSQVQEMVDRGLIRPEDAIRHPLGHILVRAVGVRGEVEVDRAEGEVEPGDVFLLCSDGLHGFVEEGAIAAALRLGPSDATDRLVELALSRGAPDNVTVITVGLSGPTRLRRGKGAAPT
jgi:serine/threonine protein phosphatase Stp1